MERSGTFNNPYAASEFIHRVNSVIGPCEIKVVMTNDEPEREVEDQWLQGFLVFLDNNREIKMSHNQYNGFVKNIILFLNQTYHMLIKDDARLTKEMINQILKEKNIPYKIYMEEATELRPVPHYFLDYANE